MKRRVFVISHSSMDLVSTLNHYERYRDECDVTIIVSSTDGNLKFLRAVNIPEASLKFLEFASRHNTRKKQIVSFLRQLRAEKKVLDEFVKEINGNEVAEVVFHSYDNDPYAGYLVSRLTKTHRVTLVDVLGISPKRLMPRELMTTSGIKNMIFLSLVSSVFGRLFMLSGTRSFPILSLDLGKINVLVKPKRAGGTIGTLAKYRYRAPVDGKSAFVLYADSFGVSENRHVAIYREVVDCLVRFGFRVVVKVHPQSKQPSFLDDYGVHCVPKYIPFEFVDLANVSLVVGLSGASLLCTERVPTVSILKMMCDENSDHYKSAMVQLSQNNAIKFVRSVDEFGQLLGRLQ